MHRHINDVQSVIVSKKVHPTVESAMKYVDSLKLNSHFKLHPDSKANVWRFRQHNPISNMEYFTKDLKNGGKLVIDRPHHENRIRTYEKMAHEIGHHHGYKDGKKHLTAKE